MKTALSLAAFTLLTLSCDSTNFKAGDCVQKPDSMVVWEVKSVNGDKLVLAQNQNPQVPNQQSSDSSGWIKTECSR